MIHERNTLHVRRKNKKSMKENCLHRLAKYVLFAVLLLYRRITSIGKLSKLLWVGVMGTMLWIIVAGLSHFNAARAFSFPPGAFTLSHEFFIGMGSAMLIATYDYWGYYNVCFLGGEIKDPGKTIPRALLLSIVLVAGLYIVMNISILGVLPWQELAQAPTWDEAAHEPTLQPA